MRTAFCVQYRERPEWIDELRAPSRDIFELSWAPQRTERAIHMPNSTWTQGRNRLARAVFAIEARRAVQYDYIIFSDDDISFEKMSHAEGLAKFEETIAKHRPAVAAPNYCWHFENQKHLDREAEVQGIYATDLLLQAMHRDVWPVLLPYWEEFDSQSWWNSGHVQNRIAGTTYRGAVVNVNTVTVKNGRSSEYPRDGKCKAADAMLQELARPGTMWYGHETKKSFEPIPLQLQHKYHRSELELAQLWNMEHRYWSQHREQLAMAA